MFSQECVKISVHRAEGAFVAGKHAWLGASVVGGHAERGACMAGETATAVDGTHPTKRKFELN